MGTLLTPPMCTWSRWREALVPAARAAALRPAGSPTVRVAGGKGRVVEARFVGGFHLPGFPAEWVAEFVAGRLHLRDERGRLRGPVDVDVRAALASVDLRPSCWWVLGRTPRDSATTRLGEVRCVMTAWGLFASFDLFLEDRT